MTLKLTLLVPIIAAALLAAVVLPAHAEKGCADVNKDGIADTIDAAIILQVDAGLYDPGLILQNMWDPHDDNIIDSRDALLVLQYDAGIINTLDGCYGPEPTPTQLPI
jgi:hypothetical protein